MTTNNSINDIAESGAAVQQGQGIAGLALSAPPEPRSLTAAERQLRQMVIDAVAAPTSKAAYGHALDQLFAFAAGRPLSRALLNEWRSMEGLAASTINVRLSAVRRLVAEARHAGMLDAEEAARLTDVPNIRERGTRLGNWLTKEQARELLAVPDRQTLKGKRDYVILGLLVGCALRRRELASLDVAEIQLRENRWVIADLRGKGGGVRTVAVPLWVKHAINAWQAAAGIEDGPLLRQIRKGGKVSKSLSDLAVWAIVQQATREIGIENFGAHDLRRTCANGEAAVQHRAGRFQAALDLSERADTRVLSVKQQAAASAENLELQDVGEPGGAAAARKLRPTNSAGALHTFPAFARHVCANSLHRLGAYLHHLGVSERENRRDLFSCQLFYEPEGHNQAFTPGKAVNCFCKSLLQVYIQTWIKGPVMR